MNREEIWVELDEFPRYLVSNHGHVIIRATDKIMKMSVGTHGHLKVGLVHEWGRQITFDVRRLVWDLFDGGDVAGHLIQNIDGDKTNCVIWNLELVKRTRRKPRRVINIDNGRLYLSMHEASRSMPGGIPVGRLQYAAQRPGMRVSGYRFEYVDE